MDGLVNEWMASKSLEYEYIFGGGGRGQEKKKRTIPIPAIVCDTPTVAAIPNTCQNK